jgi:hypothetical protein
MLHPLGLPHIGGAAHVVGVYPSNGGRTAQGHVHVHRRTTVEYPAVADAMLATSIPTLEAHAGPVADPMIEADFSNYVSQPVFRRS